MDVKSINPISLSDRDKHDRAASPPARKPSASPVTPEPRRELVGPLARRVLEDSGIAPKELGRFRVQLEIDEGTGRVIAEIRDKDTGELVDEVPSRKVLRQAAMLREAIGMILDKRI